eukprot:235542_1
MCNKPRFLCQPDWIDILGLLELMLVWCAGIITIYSLYIIMTKYRNNGFVKHRELKFTFVFSLILIFEMFISRTYLHCYCIFMLWGFNVYPQFTTNNVPPPWTVVLIYSIFWLIMALQGLRIWKLFYNQQTTVILMDDCWASLINDKYGAKNNWFIKQRYRWGSTIWLMRFFVPITIGCIFIGLLFTSHTKTTELWPHFFNIFWMSIPSIFSCYVLYKSRANRIDIFGIKTELLILTICILFGIIVYFITFMIFNYSNLVQYNVTYYRITWVIYSFVSSTIMIGLALTTTLCPLCCNKNIMKGIHSQYENNHEIHMNEVLQNSMGFRLFMKYLCTEFSMESMLFLVELTQIKCHLQKRMLFDTTTKTKIQCTFTDVYEADDVKNSEYIEDNTLKTLKFCKGLVLSPIIIQQQSIGRYEMEAMIYIYNKYFAEDAMFPLSMSYKNRVKIKKILFDTAEEISSVSDMVSVSNKCMRLQPVDEHGNDDIINIFDGVAVEFIYCLHDSFIRFQNDEEYIEYSKIIVDSVSVSKND